jgi:hypothetical protein
MLGTFSSTTNIIDDHVSFIKVGAPAVDVVDAEYGRMGAGFDAMGEFHHTNADAMDKVSQYSLEVVGRTILLTADCKLLAQGLAGPRAARADTREAPTTKEIPALTVPAGTVPKPRYSFSITTRHPSLVSGFEGSVGAGFEHG